MEHKVIKRLSTSKENYLRMLILFIPYLDYSFFHDENKNMKNKILLALNRFGGFSNIDMVTNLIDFYYPKSHYDVDDYYERLREVSKDLLTYHDGRMCIDMFDDHNQHTLLSLFNNKVLDFLEINKLISNSLLMAFYNVSYGYDIDYCLKNDMLQSISVVNHQLNLVLSKGIAETHTHVVGSIPFERQWNWLAHELYNENKKAEEILNQINVHKEVISQKEKYGYRGDLVLLVESALVLRLLMILFLIKNREWLNGLQFDIFIDKYCEELNIKSSIEKLFNFINSKDGNIDDVEIYMDELKTIIKKIKEAYYPHNQFNDNSEDSFSKELYKELFLRCVFNDDHQQLSEVRDINEHIEYVFQHESLRYIDNKKDDKIYEKMFLYYIRVKNFIHSFIVQSTGIKGFLEFQSFFRKQNAIYDIPQNMFSNIFQAYLYENVKYLEIRIGHIKMYNSNNKYQNNELNLINRDEIEKIEKVMYQTFLSFVRSYKYHLQNLEGVYQGHVPQAGLILHFNKRYEKIDKCWEEYYARNYADSLIRYKEYQNECFLNLLLFQKMRSEITYADDYLIGIDTASNELLTEPWVFAPVFRSVKDKYSSELKKFGEYYNIKIKNQKNLGITYHVGEVFYSLGSGMRHVDEVIEYFGFQNGERLGHATVLGVDIDEYINNRNIETLPAIEMLDNLLWFHYLKSRKNLFNEISIAYLEEKIWDIVHFIYNDENGSLIGNISIHHLYTAYKKQFTSLESLKDLRQGCQGKCSSNYCKDLCIFKKQQILDENLLLLSRHCHYFLKKMTRKVQININDDILKSIYKEVQHYLIDKISKKGIIIETNPVSNVNIGEISGMSMHPIIKFNDSFNEGLNRVMVSINTDDPGVFSTTLKNQYGYILEILMKQGIPMEKALLWIDQVRENGMNSTFINKTKSKIQIIEELEQIEKEIQEMIGKEC